MTREVTMQSVFFAGFKAAWENGPDTQYAAAGGASYFDARNEAWLNYVKELEENAK